MPSGTAQTPFRLYPSTLGAVLAEFPDAHLAVDTETSGLFRDSGARVSTVSVAFRVVPKNGPRLPSWQKQWEGGITTFEDGVLSAAWPFDQGVEGTGKPEDKTGALSLWDETSNLPEEEYAALIDVLCERALVFHNAKFDLHMFRGGVRRWPGRNLVDLCDRAVWDTQNGAALLTFPRLAVTGLKPTSSHLFGEESADEQKVIKAYLKKKKLPKGRWDLMPWDVVAKYADLDARLTLYLFEWQLAHLGDASEEGWLDGLYPGFKSKQFTRRRRLTPAESLARRHEVTKLLYRVENRGLPFDTEASFQAADSLAQVAERLTAKLPFSPPTLPRAKKYWFDELGLEPFARTETGGGRVDLENVERMVKRGDPGAQTWADLQKVTLASTRWYHGWASRAGEDGRLRTSVRQYGTVSGRFSVENVQLQAIPKDYRLGGPLSGVPTPRKLIENGVPEGYELWELDLAQAELRVAAMLSGCTPMLEAIDQGRDLHGETATNLFNVSPGDEDWGFRRTIAKRSNFSLVFGVGADTFQADLGKEAGVYLSNGEVFRLVRDWNQLYPQYKRKITELMGLVEHRSRTNRGRGWVTAFNGERRWFKPGEDLHKAFNQLVQSNLAQYALDWWLASERLVDEALRDWLGDDEVEDLGLGAVLVVHDSVVLLLPKDDPRSTALVEKVCQLGRDVWSEWFSGVPGDVDATRWAK